MAVMGNKKYVGPVNMLASTLLVCSCGNHCEPTDTILHRANTYFDGAAMRLKPPVANIRLRRHLTQCKLITEFRLKIQDNNYIMTPPAS